MGLVAPRHVGSSWTSDRTRVPCIGRQILNHCATREVPGRLFLSLFILFIYFWLRWAFVAVHGLSLVAASGATLRCGAQASHCGGFSCCGARAVGAWASVVVAHGLSSCGSQALEHRLSSCGARA